MVRSNSFVVAIALVGVLVLSSRALAVVIAADDTTNSPYNDGWQAGDNGGTGFAG